MTIWLCQATRRWIIALFVSLFPLATSASSVTYTYDQLGRLTTAHYDNGLCIAYAYDANGNRTAQTNTISSPAETPIWGSGVWGCFPWTQQ